MITMPPANRREGSSAAIANAVVANAATGATNSPQQPALQRPQRSQRTDHARRLAAALLLAVMGALVVLNVRAGLRVTIEEGADAEGGGDGAGGGPPPAPSLPKGFLARRLYALVDFLLFQASDERDEGEAVSHGTSAPVTNAPVVSGDVGDEGAAEEAEEQQLEALKAPNARRKWQFAEDVAAELSVHGDAMVAHGAAFAAHVAAVLKMPTDEPPRASPLDASVVEVNNGGNGGGDAFSRCRYFTAGQKLRRHEYSHRQRRAGEYRTHEYYGAVRKAVLLMDGAAGEGGDDSDASPDAPIDNARSVGRGGEAVWRFSPPIPAVLNHFPIAAVDDPLLNISVPFGSWKAVFFPLDGLGAAQQSSDLPRHLRPPQITEGAPPLFAAVVRDAFLSQGHLVTCGGDVLTAGGCLWDFSLRPGPHHRAGARHVSIGVPLCDKWCNGYYHFTHEHLPRLALVHALLTDPNADARLVLSHPPNGFQRGFLVDVLGIPAGRILGGANAMARVGVYPMPQRCGNTFTHLLHMMRRIVYTRLGLGPALLRGPSLAPSVNGGGDEEAPPTEGDDDIAQHKEGGVNGSGPRLPRLLFAERGDFSRMPRNYTALKADLMREFSGRIVFDTVRGAGSVRSQIIKFYKADIVLGPHGANIANIMWMRHGAHVIEISAAGDGNMCYYTTAGRVGLVHHLLLRSGPKAGRFNLTYGLFRSHVEAAMLAVEQSIADGSA